MNNDTYRKVQCAMAPHRNAVIDRWRESINDSRAANKAHDAVARIPLLQTFLNRPVAGFVPGGARLDDRWQAKVAVPLKRAVTDAYGESVITRRYESLQRLHERGRSILKRAQDDYRDLRT